MSPTLFLAMVLAIAAVASVWMLGGWLIARYFLYGSRRDVHLTESPADRGIDSQHLNIPIGQTHTLTGWMLRPARDASAASGNACIVMVHGFGSSKDRLWTFPDDTSYQASTLDQGAVSLWEAGFHVVAIDLRNHGQSDDHGNVTLGAHEHEDVLLTVDYLIENADQFGIDPDRIGLRGESMGGAACLIAAANDEKQHVAAVWADSAYADAAGAIEDFMAHFGVPRAFSWPVRFWLLRITGVALDAASPIKFINRIECPVMLTHSSGDTMIPYHHFERLSESDRWQQRPDVWQLTDHLHNRLWKEPTYHDRQIEFFRRHLGS